MKILILANNDIGLYKFRKELILKLIELGNEVYISLPYGKFVDELKTFGCKYIETSLSRRGVNPFKELKLIRQYKKQIKEVKPDYVLTYTIKPNVYGGIVSSRLKVPYIANITGLGSAVENPGLLQKITLILYKKALKKAKCVFFQNEENKNFMIKNHVIKGNYDLIPGSGVNLNEYKLLEYPNNENINFTFVARIMKEKGIDQFLDCAEYIKNKYQNITFNVCGFCEQSYQERLKQLQDANVIVYHGLVTNMNEIYKITNCVIHPTYYPEGMSNVLLEASACGRPIITTNRSGCKEIIDDNVNGFLIEEKNSQDLIEKVEKFLSLSFEEQKQMGLSGRNKIEKEFDRNIVINKYLEQLNLKED